MASGTFTPYWRQICGSLDPYSFVFFVVAQIAGRRRSIAVVSSRASADLEGSLQGSPLIAACQRIVTIFTDTINHPAIRAELALATGYYMGKGEQNEYHLGLVELPENPDGYRQPRLEILPWDHASIIQFPFISACLLQGVGFDPHTGYCYQARPAPLGTVYRDTSVEWGMIVVDITELDKVRYGIVGFASAPMKWASSPEAILMQRGVSITMANEPGGEFRVLDEIRPRVVMSATEYMIKVPSPVLQEHENMTKLLASVPLVEANALEIIWPAGLDDVVALPMGKLSLRTSNSLQEQTIRSLLQSTIDDDEMDISSFQNVRKIPNFREILQNNLVQYSGRLGNTRSAGLLLRLAFDNGEHLGLEHLDNTPTKAITAAIDIPEMGKISSLSLCISSIPNLSTEFVERLLQSENLREIHFMQSPFRNNDTIDWHLVEALCTRRSLLPRVKVVFAGSYSAALRKNLWLPTISEKKDTSTDTVQVAPLSLFPIQQILIRCEHRSDGIIKSETGSVYLGDSLLSPERFASGFLTYLSTFSPIPPCELNSSARLFSFSSAPASLSASILNSAEISPIPAESFALGDDCLPENISPKIRNLLPNGWTVLISSENHWDAEAARSWGCHGNPELRDVHSNSESIRYALVRACNQVIEVENPPSTPPGPDELEVVGLEEFLMITAPEVDRKPLDQRLREVAERLIRRPGQGILPKNVSPLSILDHQAAGDMLLECLKNAEEQNENLRIEMDKHSREQQWYPELLPKRK